MKLNLVFFKKNPFLSTNFLAGKISQKFAILTIRYAENELMLYAICYIRNFISNTYFLRLKVA